MSQEPDNRTDPDIHGDATTLLTPPPAAPKQTPSDRLRQALRALAASARQAMRNTAATPCPTPTPLNPSIPSITSMSSTPSTPPPVFTNATTPAGRSVIGLDVGSRTLKLVHLSTTSAGTRLVSAVAVDLPPKTDPDRANAVARAVARFVRGARPRLTAACCVLSGEGIATICCSLPHMDEKDLAQAVQWKLAEAAGGSVDSGTVAHCVLNPQKPGPNLDIVAAAAPRNLGGLDDLFRSDRPRLAVAIPQPVAAANLVRTVYHARQHGAIAVLDIGSASSGLAVVTQDGLEFCREIPLGADSITAALLGSMTLEQGTIEIDRQAAAEIARTYSIGATGNVDAAGTPIPATRILGLIRPVLERLASEIVRSLQFYNQSHGLGRIETLLLCGGGAALGGLPDYLTREIRIPTALLDPWSSLGFQPPPSLDAHPVLFAAAVGAAIHDPARINLLPAHVRSRRTVSLLRTGSFFATGFAVLALAVLSWTAHSQKAEMQKAVGLKQDATAPMERLASRVAIAEQYRSDLDRRTAILASLGVGNALHAAILKELSNIMPEGTCLKAISFSRTDSVRHMRLDVEIYTTPEATPVQLKQQLVTALETSPFFTNVSFSAAPPSPPGPGRSPDEELSLTCQVIGFLGD